MNKNRLIETGKMILLTLGGISLSLAMPYLTSLHAEHPFLLLNTSASIPRGLYIGIPGKELRKGDYVAYPPPEKVISFLEERGYMDGRKPKDVRFIKRVGALPGATYGIALDDYFYVNGHLTGKIRFTDKNGEAMPLERGEHIVEDGTFLPQGDSESSLDGRYTGTVPQKNIISRAVPLLVEW